MAGVLDEMRRGHALERSAKSGLLYGPGKVAVLTRDCLHLCPRSAWAASNNIRSTVPPSYCTVPQQFLAGPRRPLLWFRLGSDSVCKPQIEMSLSRALYESRFTTNPLSLSQHAQLIPACTKEYFTMHAIKSLSARSVPGLLIQRK